jgi:hypothetical protein
MKVKEINKIIEETLTNEVKKRILTEQEEDQPKNLSGLEKLASLSTVLNKIANIEDIGDENNFNVLITLNDVSEEEIKNINKTIHNDLEEGGYGDNFDVEINTVTDGSTLHTKIKITSGGDETLAKDMEEYKEEEDCQECGNNVEMNEEFSEDDLKELFGDDDEIPEPHSFHHKPENETEPDDDDITDDEFFGDEDKMPEHTPIVYDLDDLKAMTDHEMNENTKPKKVLRLTESKFQEMIKKIVAESIPGLEAVKKVQNINKRETDAHMVNVNKKIKHALDFPGNDKPAFPKPIGKGEKVAYRNTTSEEEEIEDNRGGGMENLIPQNKPSKEFTERIEKALDGDPTMGNSQDSPNAIKDEVGKKIQKAAKRRVDIKKKEPIYPKEAVPVKTKKLEESTPEVDKVILEEIERMKRIYGYNEKTQS